jgi:acyl carrier protein
LTPNWREKALRHTLGTHKRHFRSSLDAVGAGHDVVPQHDGYGGIPVMNNIDDFVALVQAEVGLLVEPDDLGRSFDELPGWDSLLLLQLLTALEQQTGRRISLPTILKASTLNDVYALVS